MTFYYALNQGAELGVQGKYRQGKNSRETDQQRNCECNSRIGRLNMAELLNKEDYKGSQAQYRDGEKKLVLECVRSI